MAFHPFNYYKGGWLVGYGSLLYPLVRSIKHHIDVF